MSDEKHEVLFRKFENNEDRIIKPVTRKVRFNINVADYKPGQIVNYEDMPPGHRHWLDTEGLMETTRICEYVEVPKKKDIGSNFKDTKIPDPVPINQMSKPLCPGKNKDGSPCGRDKLKANGYCFQHQSQAPTGLTSEMPENMRAIQGLT